MFGEQYIIDYAIQLIEQENYKTYITDSLRTLILLKSKRYGLQDFDYPRYQDIIEHKITAQEEEPKTAEELIDEINKKCGLTMIDDTRPEEGEM